MKIKTNKFKFFLLLLIIFSLVVTSVQATVNFRVVVPQTVYVGETFDVQVYLDVPTDEALTYAEFEYYSSSGVTRISQQGENLLSTTSTINDVSQNFRWRYAETRPLPELLSGTNFVVGNNLLFATATYQAGTSPRSVEFFFNRMVASGSLRSSYATSASQDPTQRTVNIIVPNCGNGIIEGNEECDSSDLQGFACDDIGSFTGGTLSCNPTTCQIDTTGCTTVSTLLGDTDNSGCIDVPELFSYIDSWYAGTATITDLFQVIDNWYISGC